MTFHRKLLLVSALAAASVAADARDHSFEVYGGLGRTLMGADNMDDATNYNLGLGYVLNDRWTLELMATEMESGIPGTSVDIRSTQYRLDALYHFADGKVRPYVAFGAGNQRLSPEGGNPSHQDMINLGVGIKHRLNKYIDWRTEVRAFNSVDEHFTDVQFNTGLSFLFGHSEKAVPAAVVVPAAEVDSDKDGVVDSKDKCPDTPTQYKVDADGCPMELTQAVSIDLAVTFDSDSAVIKDEFMAEVKKVAEFMNQYLNTQVSVEGHTDSTGSAPHNKALSQRRADAVRDALVSRYNISADRVKSVGYGQAKPIASNATVEGRAQNRRVVAEISTDVTRKVTR